MSDSTSSSSSTASSGQDQERSRFSFQHGCEWFDMIRSDWEELTVSLRKDKEKLRILEVGAFEGASTTWILDNLMSHPESSLTVIDSFAGGMEHQQQQEQQTTPPDDGDGDQYKLDSLESRFWSNVSKCTHVTKMRMIKAFSDDALMALRQEGAQFDFIYIDASHVAVDVLHDAVLCWRMLQVQGTMVFDDYTWKGYNEESYNPRVAILSFLRCAAHELRARETQSQVWVTKVPTRITPTKNPDPELMYWDRCDLTKYQ